MLTLLRLNRNIL